MYVICQICHVLTRTTHDSGGWGGRLASGWTDDHHFLQLHWLFEHEPVLESVQQLRTGADRTESLGITQSTVSSRLVRCLGSLVSEVLDDGLHPVPGDSVVSPHNTLVETLWVNFLNSLIAGTLLGLVQQGPDCHCLTALGVSSAPSSISSFSLNSDSDLEARSSEESSCWTKGRFSWSPARAPLWRHSWWTLLSSSPLYSTEHRLQTLPRHICQ